MAFLILIMHVPLQVNNNKEVDMSSKIIYGGARIIGFFIFCISVKSACIAQNGKVWATIDNISGLQLTTVNQELHSSNPYIQRFINELSIRSVEQALPTSRKPALLKVYELSCSCNEHELLQQVSKLSSYFSSPTLAPKYEPLSLPNDYVTSFSTDYALDLINAKDAWDITQGSSSVVLTISDGNYAINHEELVGKYIYITPNNQNANYSHGTAVAITAAGKTNNGIGKSAIGYNSALDLRAMSYSEVLTASNLGVKVVNLSWTSGCYYNSYIQQLLDEVYENGTFVIASAGNGSTCGGPNNLVYPAAHNHVFSVSSVGPSNNHQQIIGNPSATHQHNASVDLCAPGYDVPLSIASGVYTTGNGTSFAAPFVTGTVGLMLAVNPCLKPDDIEYILKASAYNLNAANPSYIGLLGAGRLDAHAAVLMAQNYNSLTISTKQYIDCKNEKQSINLDVKGGKAPYTVQWEIGFEGNELTGVNPGEVYDGTVTDNAGCTSSFQVIAENVPSFSLSADIEHVRCYGRSSGSIDVNVLGGTPGFIYQWSTGETSSSITNLAAGNYSLSVSDKNGCKTWESFTVNEPSKLIASTIIKSETKSAKGEIDLTVSGGVSPYTYEWSNGQSSQDLTNLTKGKYSVHVIDGNNCSLFASFAIYYSSYSIVSTIKSAGADAATPQVLEVSDSSMENVRIFPNPSADNMAITWEATSLNALSIFDLNGKLVHSAVVQEEATSYQVDQLETGVYLVEMQFRDGKTERKKITFI
jgi:hypothetical protein